MRYDTTVTSTYLLGICMGHIDLGSGILLFCFISASGAGEMDLGLHLLLHLRDW